VRDPIEKFGLVVELLLPPLVALVPLTVRAPPLGLPVSGLMVKLAVLVRLALLWAVTVWLPEAPTAPDQA
jgi:hypothetical protein